VTWDHDAGVSVIYVNGIKVGHSDTTTPPHRHEQAAPYLFFGSPGYAMGDISFYDRQLTDADMASLFKAEARSPDAGLQTSLEHTYLGKNLPPFAWSPDANDGWEQALALKLDDRESLRHFFQQGTGPSLRWTPDGMRITTPPLEDYLRTYPKTLYGTMPDMTRMYLWTRRMFEGDLYVTVEFRIHQHGGLALLMAQAAGMQGEDFLEDYPLRTDGSMRTVHGQDVRNYHWEFYREMVDTRNDLVSHAVLKNPWYRPVAFQIENRKWELERWYRVTWLQEDTRLRGAIDSVTVVDAHDSGFDNNGPVLRNGHVALRAMMRTDMTFRNLEIWTRPHVSVIEGGGEK
jgi:hypothetical protein